MQNTLYLRVNNASYDHLIYKLFSVDFRCGIMVRNNFARFGFALLVLVLVTIMGLVGAFATQVSVIASNPAPVIAGEYADITIQLTGTHRGAGDSVENATFFIKETAFIKPVPNQELVVQNFYQNQVLTRTFRVYFANDIPPGRIPITIVQQMPRLTTEYQTSLLVQGAQVQPTLRVGEMRSIPTSLIADTTDNQATFVLQNLGDREAQLLKLTLVSSYLEESYMGSLQTSLAKLEGGSQVDVLFDFDIVANTPSSIPATLVAEYRVRNQLDTNYEMRRDEIPLSLTLANTPYFTIESESVKPLQVGKSNQQLLVTVSNTNERRAESVRVRLFPDPSAPLDFEKTTFFVTPLMEKDETSTFIIGFDVMDSALLQDYRVRAEVESVVGQNRYVQTEQIVFSIEREKASTVAQNGLVLAIVFIVVAIIIGFLYVKRRKND